MPICDAHGHLLCLFCSRPRFMARWPERDYTNRWGKKVAAYRCESCGAFDAVTLGFAREEERAAA